MQDLQVIGVENGALVVASDDGTRFRLPIDDVLQSKVRQSIPDTGEGRKLAPAELKARLGRMSVAERAELPGVSGTRAHQMLAGALVVEGAMDLLRLDRLDIAPWALREGIILRRLDHLEADGPLS